MRRLRILYVEDNEQLRHMIGMLLEELQHDVVLCASGEEALVACAGDAFDLVVTDVSLPGMSGTTLVKQLVAQDPGRWIAVCSGYNYAEAVSTLGIHVRSLPKPFEVEQLEALLSEVDGSMPGA